MDMMSLLIRRIHCWEAFSLSQSVLSVGSQDVAWIWDRRPAPATPSPTPGRGEEGCREWDMATTGGEEPGLKLFPNPTGWGRGVAEERPLCPGRGGEAEPEPEPEPELEGAAVGEFVKVGNSEAPLPGPRAPLLDSSAKLSAMVR